MISDDLLVEISVVRTDGEYSTFVTGLNGRPQWDYFADFRISVDEEGDVRSIPSVEKVLDNYRDFESYGMEILVKLELIDEEFQTGAAEGEYLHLKAYYTVSKCEVLSFESFSA